MVQARTGSGNIVPLMVRVPEDLRERIKTAADINGRSQNSEIVSTLLEKYPAPREPLDGGLESWVEYVTEGSSEDQMRQRVRLANQALDKAGLRIMLKIVSFQGGAAPHTGVVVLPAPPDTPKD